jgi:hypothetical protein
LGPIATKMLQRSEYVSAVDGQAAIDLERPRSIWELLGATVNLYFRVPVLFLVLAVCVLQSLPSSAQ